MATVWTTAKDILRYTSPLISMVIEGVEKATGAVNSAADKGIEPLRQEVAKQEIRLGFEMQQAKIAQELAIAQRILNAEVVEIEEFYDRSGKGQLGLKLEPDVPTLGLGAEGKSVVKRIYKFSGRRSPEGENSTPDISNSGPQQLPA